MVLPDATVARNLEEKEKREQIISPVAVVGIIAETTSKKKKKKKEKEKNLTMSKKCNFIKSKYNLEKLWRENWFSYCNLKSR